MKTLWFVNYGPDVSHLWDSSVFNTLKEAKIFGENLNKTPYGGKRPYKIIKAVYEKSRIYGDTVKFQDVAL